jgi:hypothetical protein
MTTTERDARPTTHEPVTHGTGQWVIVTRYQPPNGYAVINVYGPYPTQRAAISARRRIEGRNADDPRAPLVEYRVREIMRDEPGMTS